MKKLVSVTLIFVMLLSIFSISGFGVSDAEDRYEDFDPDIHDYDVGEIWVENETVSGLSGNGTVSSYAIGTTTDKSGKKVLFPVVDKTTNGEVEPQLEKNVKAKKEYKLSGMPTADSVQSFTIGTSYIYLCQLFNEKDIYISRYKINGSSAVFKDKMTLKNIGHNQTMELYEHNGKAYMWICCRPNPKNYDNKLSPDEAEKKPSNYTTQLGRIEYKADETITNYTKISRFGSLQYANVSGQNFDPANLEDEKDINREPVMRVDAALSTDKKIVTLAVRSLHGNIQYSEFDNEVLNNVLDETESKTSKYVSFKGNDQLIDACSFSTVQKKKSRILPNNSCQGIDVTSTYGSIYIAGGTGVNYDADTDTNRLYVPKVGKMIKNSKGGYTYTTCVNLTNTHADYTSDELYKDLPLEIEGVKIKNDSLYLALTPNKKVLRDQTIYIYSIDKALF